MLFADKRALETNLQVSLLKIREKELRMPPRCAILAPEKLLTAPHGELFVVDENGALTGTITLEDLADGAFDHSIDDVVNARDVARVHPPFLEAGASLDHALKMMQDTGEEHVAVVENRENMKLVGFIHEIDVMFVYNRALLEARREERGEL